MLDHSHETAREFGWNAKRDTGQLTHITNNLDRNKDRVFEHDALGRLIKAKAGLATGATGVTADWTQDYTYYRYGNKTATTAAGITADTNNVPSDGLASLSFNTANNRLSTSDDYVFDSSGNTTGDAEGRTFVYDAENKQISVSDSNGTIGEYFYDGDGKRIKKFVPSTGEETIFAYDAAGKLIGEYSTVVQTGTNAKTVYTTNDHLGSPRINTDATGQVISRHDYHPFGEEIARTGYGSDTIRKQFTGYERDIESDLDFAQARMYKFRHGRFTAVDPLLASATSKNPQSWNRYIYSFNNPLNLVDPTGLVAMDDYFINRDGSYVVVENDCECDTYYIETQKGSGEYRELTTLQENAQGQVEFPAEMDFFGRYGTVDAGGGDHGQGDHFVNPEVAAGLFGLSAVLMDEHGISMSYGDMSSSNGRDPWQKGFDHHSGHGHNSRSGHDVDFRYINNNGESFQSRTARSDSQFSVGQNQTVYDVGKSFGFTDNYQGTTQGKNTGLQGVPTAAKHNDHGHLGFDAKSARVTKAQGVSVSGGVYRPVFFKK